MVSPDYSQLRKVLRMVQELHVLGYQLIRIAPAMAPSGMYWRCAITTRANTLRTNGARLADWDRAVHYTSGDERDYFGWKDMRHARPIELAQMFVRRFPELAQEGHGPDWEYAGWYVWMMHLTYPDALPYAYADWPTPADVLLTTGAKEIRVPLPPPGDAEDPDFR